jgi:hypothetical protein
VEPAIDATVEIARGPKRDKFYDLTLPSGETIETPFRESFDPPPYTLAVGGEMLLFDIDVICELDDTIRSLMNENREYPMKPRRDGSCRIKLPVGLHLQADAKYTLVEFGSDLSDVGTMLYSPCSLREKIEFVYAYGGGVARLLDANGVLYSYPDSRREMDEQALATFFDKDHELSIDPLVEFLLAHE